MVLNETLEKISFGNLNLSGISDVINIEPIRNFFLTLFKILTAFLVIYIIFKIIELIRVYLRERRIKLTYKNTEEIKTKLTQIENRINEIHQKIFIKKVKEEKKVEKKKKPS